MKVCAAGVAISVLTSPTGIIADTAELLYAR
jgi:hypothetical protein